MSFEKAKKEYNEHLHRLHCLQTQVDDMRHIVEEKKKAMYEACIHDYEAQPREYQSPREWICRKCLHCI